MSTWAWVGFWVLVLVPLLGITRGVASARRERLRALERIRAGWAAMDGRVQRVQAQNPEHDIWGGLASGFVHGCRVDRGMVEHWAGVPQSSIPLGMQGVLTAARNRHSRRLLKSGIEGQLELRVLASEYDRAGVNYSMGISADGRVRSLEVRLSPMGWSEAFAHIDQFGPGVVHG